MASSSSYSRKPNNKNKSPMNVTNFETDPEKNTIHVNADPSNFRAVVQKLTGSSTDPTVQNLPITISPHPLNGNHRHVDVGPIRPSFNLQNEIKNTRNLHLQLNQDRLTLGESFFAPRKRMMDVSHVESFFALRKRIMDMSPVESFFAPRKRMIDVSSVESFFAPRKRMMEVSTLNTILAGGSTQRTPTLHLVEEEIAIANKDFYLHPRPFATSGMAEMAEPKLLPLFPTTPDS